MASADSWGEKLRLDYTNGKSFHVYDQLVFSKEILPLYFKHNNIASFIRQLNMYGFRKVMNIEQGTLKVERDDLQFQHPYFQRDQQQLLEHIKRKGQMMKVTDIKNEPPPLKQEHITKVLGDVKQIRGKQDNMNSKLDSMKRENEALWREVASLRQKHMKQQAIVNKLIQFLVSVVGGNRGIKTNLPKRKIPLMLNDATQIVAAKSPKYSPAAHEISSDLYSVQSPDSKIDMLEKASGPIIHDVTDLLNLGEHPRKATPPEDEDGIPILAPGFDESTDELQTLTNMDRLMRSSPAPPPSPPSSSKISTPVLDLKEPRIFNITSSKSSENLLRELTAQSLPTELSLPEDNASVSQFIAGQVASPTTSRDVVISSQTSKLAGGDISDQLDTMQTDIEGIRELLGNSLSNVDLGSLTDIFDFLPDGLQTDITGDANNIVGNELIEYTGPPSDNLQFDFNTADGSDSSIDHLQALINIDDEVPDESSKT